MTNENLNKILSEYPRKDYDAAAAEKEGVEAQIGVVNEHYTEEIGLHRELKEQVNEGDSYPYEDDHRKLVSSYNNEISPLTQKQIELEAKLRRLHAVAWNEALKKEHIDKRVQEHQEVLPAVREMHKKIEQMQLEIEAMSQRATRILREANKLAQSLEELLSKKSPTDEDEKEIRRIMQIFAEVYQTIANMTHKIVHSAVSVPRE